LKEINTKDSPIIQEEAIKKGSPIVKQKEETQAKPVLNMGKSQTGSRKSLFG